ncbi:MAG TPA: hypothetical protein VKN18_05595 [Blastocatellia bacterium]|nr:hypothetical protein [Blastocatellia bacterium]
MSDLSSIKDFMLENGGVLAAGSILEEDNPIAEELEHAGETVNLERTDAQQVKCDGNSEFRFFEDGIQRTLYVGHLIVNGFHIPVHYCTAAAVILQREDRSFHLVEGLFLKRDMLLVSRANVPIPSTLDRLTRSGVEVVDTGRATRNFNELCRAAQYQAKDERLAVEKIVIEKWAETFKDGSFLVIDGTLMNLRSEDAVARCLGVSKEVIERYFELHNHRKIYGLIEGERSWVFHFKTADDDPRLGARDRLSWYLRIRNTKGRHPEFGLLRCELSKAHADRCTELAERFSSSLFAERYPIAFPDPRWDRLLYPIRQCEQYLRSRCRPVASVQAAFGRTQRI